MKDGDSAASEIAAASSRWLLGARERAEIMKKRHLQPEILDDLSPDDPRAIESRRDLFTINRLMGHAGMVTRALRAAPSPPQVLVELGSGDGTFLLRLAHRLAPLTGVRARLVDRRPAVSNSTLQGFEAVGWSVEVCEADVFEWLRRPGAESSDATIATLFLHHFNDGQLSELLKLAARQTTRFIACEPRRSRIALAAVPLMRAIGCNEVTLHDGDISVRAGFRDRELSTLWPSGQAWTIVEKPQGLFTHAFVAARDGSAPTAAPPARQSRSSA